MRNRQVLYDHLKLSDYMSLFDQTTLLNMDPDNGGPITTVKERLPLPKILVVGYYDKGNLGDEAFKSCFSKIGQMTFVSSDKFNSVPSDIDVVICGGGDIINNYFCEHIRTVLSTFTGPVYAFSVGIPYLSGLQYLDIFDHVIIRANQDLQIVEDNIHIDNVTYMPDFTVLLKTPAIKRPFTGTPRIGFFLSQPAFVNTPPERELVNKITEIINRAAEFAEVYLLAFNTGDNPNENDIVLNDQVYDLLTANGPRSNIINVKDTFLKKPEAMMKFMVSLDLAFCMRYHSVMFSLIQNVSFVSMYTTRKIDNQLKDVGMEDYGYMLPLDERYKPTDIDVDRAVDLIRYGLAHPNNNYKFADVDLDYIREILSTKKRKTLKVLRTYNKSKEDCLNDIQDFLQDYLEIDDLTYYQFLMGTKQLPDVVGSKDTQTVARLICYGITETLNAPYVWGLNENMVNQSNFKLVEAINWIYNDYNTHLRFVNESGLTYPSLSIEKRALIDLQYIRQDDNKNLHRSGWSYVLGGLYQLDKTVLNKDLPAIMVDTYVDRTFHWAADLLSVTKHIPYTIPWMGFIHHTFETEYSEYNCDVLFQKQVFKDSLPTCKCLIVLSNYLADTLRTYLNAYGFPHIPVRVLRHPTETPDLKFTMQRFMANQEKKIVQIGGWLRNSYAIFDLPIDPIFNNGLRIKKAVLKGKEMDNYFQPEGMFDYLTSVLGLDVIPDDLLNDNGSYTQSAVSGDICPDTICRVKKNVNKYVSGMVDSLRKKDCSVTIIDTLSNNDYDVLLSENIVFLNLIDCSAVNTVLECIVRNTPIIVNRHPALEEVLGTAYPGFYTSMLQASLLATDLASITSITNYLSGLDKTDLNLDTFVNKFQDVVLEVNDL
jgi:hypothetical protein